MSRVLCDQSWNWGVSRSTFVEVISGTRFRFLRVVVVLGQMKQQLLRPPVWLHRQHRYPLPPHPGSRAFCGFQLVFEKCNNILHDWSYICKPISTKESQVLPVTRPLPRAMSLAFRMSRPLVQLRKRLACFPLPPRLHSLSPSRPSGPLGLLFWPRPLAPPWPHRRGWCRRWCWPRSSGGDPPQSTPSTNRWRRGQSRPQKRSTAEIMRCQVCSRLLYKWSFHIDHFITICLARQLRISFLFFTPYWDTLLAICALQISANYVYVLTKFSLPSTHLHFIFFIIRTGQISLLSFNLLVLCFLMLFSNFENFQPCFLWKSFL